ncbi:MAG: hypothetical protein M3N57_02790 [Actinomycetota bacterium]|nr:hypothetical protein [Actinomycetota bacterium]
MVLWWIGNLIFLFVVIPAVLVLLSTLLSPIEEIRIYADDALDHAQNVLAALDDVEGLLDTRSLVRDTSNGVQRYAAALDHVL